MAAGTKRIVPLFPLMKEIKALSPGRKKRKKSS
jgi:hypothetical protein